MVLETDKKWWFWDVEDADLCKDFCGYDLILDPKHKDIMLEADWHQWRKKGILMFNTFSLCSRVLLFQIRAIANEKL